MEEEEEEEEEEKESILITCSNAFHSICSKGEESALINVDQNEECFHPL